MKMSTITLEPRASVGTRAIVLYDTVVGEEAFLAPLSLVMKAERLMPRTRWRGIPVRAAQDQRPLEPAPPVGPGRVVAPGSAAHLQPPAAPPALPPFPLAVTDDRARDHPGGDLSHVCITVTPSPAGSDTGLPPAAPRIAGIDVACGIALLGMIAMHVTPAVTPSGDVATGWAIASSAALLAVLVGTGLGLSTHSRSALRGARWTATVVGLVVRAMRIVVIGLLLAAVVRADMAGILLACYAVLFSLAVAEAARALPGSADRRGDGGCARGQPRRAWRDGVIEHQEPAVRRPVDQPVPGRREALTGLDRAPPWLAYVCAGMAVGRSLLTARRFVLGMIIAGIAWAAVASAVPRALLDRAGGTEQLSDTTLRTMTDGVLERAAGVGSEGVMPTSSLWWLANAIAT